MFGTFLFFAGGLALATGRVVPFFRRDYSYIEDFDSFYKLHSNNDEQTWNSAFLTCEDEGATLFYPGVPGEWQIVQTLMHKAGTKWNETIIFVGIHDEFGFSEYITADGKPTPLPILEKPSDIPLTKTCITMNTKTGSYSYENCERNEDKKRPFVCKKKIEQNPCGTTDQDYTYTYESKKCYKFHKKPKTWTKAMETCFMEGGSLLVIKDKMELEMIQQLHVTISRYYDNERRNDMRFFVGFRRSTVNDEFHTVKGENFLKGFYYNSNLASTSGDCGTLTVYFDRYTLQPDNCLEERPFICQIDVV